MYAASVPVYQRQLTAISKVLEKGSAWAAAKKVDEAVIMGTRMIPDMLPFSRQVQIACRFAEESVARLAGAEVPKAPENAEKNLAELRVRIEAVLDFIKGFRPELIDGSETREITLTIGGNPDEVYESAISHAYGDVELLFPLHDHLRNLASVWRRNRETGFPRRRLRICGQAVTANSLGLFAAMCITARQPGGPQRGRRFVSPFGGWHAVSGSAHIR